MTNKELTLEQLGLSQEVLAEKLVDKIASGLMTTLKYDEDSGEWYGESAFAGKLNKLVKDRLDQIVTDLANAHVLPKVNSIVENMVLTETNRWGEKTGKSMTFTEYLVQRAEAYMQEEVDFQGNPKGSNSGFSWSARGTRVAYMIHKHLHYEIEAAMKTALQNVNSSVAKGLHEATKIALNEVTSKLSVSVKTS